MYKYDLKAEQGSTLRQALTVTNTDNQPFDFTGYTAKAQVRPYAGSSTLTSEMNVEIAENRIEYSLTDEQTKAIQPGTYAYDLTVKNEEIVLFLIGGKLIIEPAVTLWENET